jgi:chorismate mutase
MPERLEVKTLSQWEIPYEDVFFIAGPCSAETEEQVMQTALALKNSKVNAMRAGIWKPRTRPGSFEGVGYKGLEWLKNAGKAAGIMVITEVATPEHVEACLKHEIDMLWVGARTTSNPFAVQSIADSLKGLDIPVWVKNPVSPDIDLWAGALERLNQAGLKRIGAIHRGFSVYQKGKFRNQPIWRVPIEVKRRNSTIPLLCDPSHICGNRELLFSVAQNAMDLLFDGLMMEVHIDPPSALSDSKQQVTPEEYDRLIRSLKVRKAYSQRKDYLEHISLLRLEIDRVDNEILKLLARRMDKSKRIALQKMKDNISLFQPERWEEVVRSRVEDGAAYNLSEDFVLRLYQLIHEESLRVQEDVVSD